MNCSPQVPLVHGIFQARILEWVAISSPRDLPKPGIELVSPCLSGKFFTTEPFGKSFVRLRSDQSLTHVRLFVTPWIAARQASLSITNSRSSPDSCLSSQWCPPAISSPARPLLLLPPIPPSIRAFSTESTLCMRWPTYWSFSFSIIPSKEIPGLISLWHKCHNQTKLPHFDLESKCQQYD